MKARELMLENYLMFNNEVVQVAAIAGTIISFKKINGWVFGSYDIEEFKPIPLTKKWLKKFGFFKYNNAYVLKNPGTNPTRFYFSIWHTLEYNTAELDPPLEYVHQLQNLYFVLTGKELVAEPARTAQTIN